MPPLKTFKSLNPKQDRFAREYVVDLCATKAAVRAGYAKNSASVTGSRLLGKAKVQEAVKHYAVKVAKKVDLSAEYVLGALKSNAERSRQAEPVLDHEGEPTGLFKYDSSGSNKALELLGKHLRLFVNLTEISLGPDVEKWLDTFLDIVEQEATDPETLGRIVARMSQAANSREALGPSTEVPD